MISLLKSRSKLVRYIGLLLSTQVMARYGAKHGGYSLTEESGWTVCTSVSEECAQGSGDDRTLRSKVSKYPSGKPSKGGYCLPETGLKNPLTALTENLDQLKTEYENIKKDVDTAYDAALALKRLSSPGETAKELFTDEPYLGNICVVEGGGLGTLKGEQDYYAVTGSSEKVVDTQPRFVERCRAVVSGFCQDVQLVGSGIPAGLRLFTKGIDSITWLTDRLSSVIPNLELEVLSHRDQILCTTVSESKFDQGLDVVEENDWTSYSSVSEDPNGKPSKGRYYTPGTRFKNPVTFVTENLDQLKIEYQKILEEYQKSKKDIKTAYDAALAVERLSSPGKTAKELFTDEPYLGNICVVEGGGLGTLKGEQDYYAVTGSSEKVVDTQPRFVERCRAVVSGFCQDVQLVGSGIPAGLRLVNKSSQYRKWLTSLLR